MNCVVFYLLLKSCCRRLYNWLKVAPYRPDQQVEEDDDLMDESQGKGIRVLGVAYAPSRYVPHVIWFYFQIYQYLDLLAALSCFSCICNFAFTETLQFSVL